MAAVKSRREQYSDDTRAALLQTATLLFGERGYAATSLDDVARTSRVTRGAVYHHFANKQALFEAVLEQLEHAMLTRIGAAVAAETEPWAAATAGLRAFLDHCCDPVYGRICWQEGPVALGWSAWLECERRYAYSLTESFVTTLTDAGVIDPGPVDTTVSMLFWLIGGAGHTIAEQPVEHRQRVRDECEHQIVRMVNGLRTTDADGRISPLTSGRPTGTGYADANRGPYMIAELIERHGRSHPDPGA